MNAQLSTGRLIRLSHSRASKMQTCGWAYNQVYNERKESSVKSAALAIGSAFHEAVATFISSDAYGVVIDPKPIFDRAYQDESAGYGIRFSTTLCEKDVHPMAHLMLERFVAKWCELGWKAVLDPEGLPLVERDLETLLPGNVVYNGIVDVVVQTPTSEVLLVDWKAVAAFWSSDGTDSFAARSDQLVGQQILVQANMPSLGLDRLDGRAFGEITKRPPSNRASGKGPEIRIDLTGLADQPRIEDYVRELQFVAEDIRRKRFTRRPGSAFSSPCGLCELSRICIGLPDPTLRIKARATPFTEQPTQLRVV